MSKIAKAQEQKQKLQRQRAEAQALLMLNKLVTQFYEFFMNNDPDSPLIAQEQTKIGAKWKMYCVQAKLNKSASGRFDEHCTTIKEKYKETLNAELGKNNAVLAKDQNRLIAWFKSIFAKSTLRET